MAVELEGLDQIHIRDLLLRCIVGTNPEERVNKQDILINLTLYADLRQAGQSDELEHTIDYKTLKKQIIALVEESSCLLIECLAQQIADICLKEAQVQAVRVCIDKPGALRFARSAAVEIIRDRKRDG